MAPNITFTEDQITGLFGELAAEDEDIARFRKVILKVQHMQKFTMIVH